MLCCVPTLPRSRRPAGACRTSGSTSSTIGPKRPSRRSRRRVKPDVAKAPMAADTEFPPVRELLPHRGSAVLLARVLGHDAKRTVCAVDPDAGASFRDADGSIPAYVGLEFMAQTIAAHG